MTVRAFAIVLLAASAGTIGPRRAAAQVQGELRGRLTDARTARPVANGRVEVIGRPEVVRSGADGTFVLRGLEPRAYEIRVRAIGYQRRDVDVQIANGRTTTLDIALEPSVAVLGAVVVTPERETLRPNAVTFDRRAIESSGRRDLGELLQTAPGVLITQAGGPGAASHVSIRGSSSSEVLVLIDGVPLNSGVSGEADLSRIALETVERVTVRTGAQSARYGARALAGVIEIETRGPAHEASTLVRAGAWGERNASATVGAIRPLGARRAGGSLTADYRTVRGDFSYDLPALRGGGTARRTNSDVISRQFLGSLSVEGDNGAVGVRGSWQKISRGLEGSIIQPSTTGRQSHARLRGGADGRWERGPLSWQSAADLTRERATFTDPAPPFGTTYDDTVDATGFTGSSSIALARGPITGSLGGELRALNLRATVLEAGAPRSQTLTGGWGSLRVAHIFDAARTRLDAEVSGRLDHSSLIDGLTASPRVAASLSRGLVVASASLGTGYAPPSLADQFFHEGVLVRANPKLEPERTRRDIEGRLALHEMSVGPLRLGGEAAAFRADVDGMILWLPDFRFIWSPSNFAVRRSGWELSGRAALPAAALQMQGTLSRSDVAYTGPVLSGQVAYRPRTTASVTTSITPRRGRLEITNRHVGARRTVPGSGLNQLDPYWLTDARIGTAHERGAWLLDATLGLENLFDRSASMLVDYPFPSRTWTVAVRMRRADVCRFQ